MSRGRTTGLVLLTSLLGSLAVAPSPSGAAPAPTRGGGHCVHQSRIDVPGAPVQRVDCLDDLTTASTVATNHTDASDWAGLNAPGTHNPSGVPGIQVDGYFPDTSTSNTHHGWNHDSQFVVRLPDHWNGRLVVSGAPGTRTQYAGDFLFSDWLLAHGYAYAMTDKGNDGSSFYKDGKEPGDAIAEWNHRVTQLTRATRQVVAQRYGRVPARTYLFGISNGGYLVRWQLENRPGLYDGGVDWGARSTRRRRPTCSPTCRSRCATTRSTRRPATGPPTGG
ncbi:tannase/feruloyl esterase family alpha/beta hydrolase [Nocardioides ungokensis]|uniref:tannase/feruloyl esterase family alpha/beta hydrolase n=1 Tax=Nocardioides ungokensis TaxID=1643322 RepID=UPI001C60EBB4|nr:tannase/feruloyl esterase family alpha/beta hydrolase [Nocardioides ungokensis]